MAFLNKSDPAALRRLRERAMKEKQEKEEKQSKSKQSQSTTPTANRDASRTLTSSALGSSNKSDPAAVRRLQERVANEKKYTDYNTETKNAYTSVKDRINSKTTIKSDMSDADRRARLKEIDNELNALGTKIHGYSRAKAYGTSKAMLEAEKRDKARLAELTEEKKKLERVGTFTGTELKELEIDDAKKKLSGARQKVNAFGARPSTSEAEAYRQAVSEQYKAQEELDELKRQKKLYDNITKYGDVVHEDNNKFGQFELPKPLENIVDLVTEDGSKEEKEISEYLKDFDSQWRTNYRANALSREADKASNRNIDIPNAENKELAYAYDYLEKAYKTNNEKALDDENVRASWLTKDLAGYLPQGIDQAVPEIVGGTVGGILGLAVGAPGKGWALGAGVGSGIQSYGVIRGSVYRELLSQGVDDETARELAADDALIESLIEGGETALGWLFAGGGKAKTAIYNAAKSSVAKGSTNAVTKFVANMATKASDKALTKAAKAVSRPLWNTAVRTGLGVGWQGLTEGLEEGLQGSISRATREKAWASIDNELGQYGAGNIDLHSRPIYKNEDGTISTVDSVTYEIDGKYVVLPTIVRDEYGKVKRLTEDEEIFNHYVKTGEYLGKFDTLETANGYANALHYAQAYRYSDSTSTEADDNVIVGGAKVLADALFGGNEEARGELAERFGGGFRVGVMLGGSHVAVNSVITHYANAKTVKAQNEIADAYIKDEKSLKELIASGKESGEGTVSEKIATEIETAMKNGKAVTREQVKRLIESTDVYKQAEETTLESAAREVVQSREASLDMLKDRQNGKVDAGMLETLTQKNVPITSEEVKKVTGFGDRGAEIVAKIANEEGNTFTQAVDEVEATYLTGFNHPEMDIKDVAHTFTTEAHKDAYTAGQIDAVKQNTEAAIKAQNVRVFGAESGVDYKNSQNIEQYTSDQIKMADTVGKDQGTKVSFEERVLANEETEYEANAWHQDGEIKRSNTSNEKFIADIMEESLHRMAEVNTEEVQVLLREAYDLVAEKERNLGAEGHNFTEQKALYDSAGQPINTRGVMEEVSVGVLSTELFRNEKAWNKWRERLDTNPELRSAWQKLCDYVSEIIEKLRRLLAEGSFSKATREKVNKDIADMKRMLDLYGKAYVSTRDAVAERTKAAESAETTTESKNEGVTSENATSDKESHTETKTEQKAKTESIKKGDVFVADKSGTKYKILSRDERNTIVEITSPEGTERTIISNEIADRNFSNMSDEGITKWIDEDSHIDNRTWEDVGSRQVKAFQYLFPEMKEYYMPLANELLSDLSNTIKGEKILTGNYVDGYEWAGQSRLTSEAIANIKDSTNASYDDIRDALERLIADKGQENIALAKRIELVFDDMLTNGYKTFEGERIPANEEYIAKKEALIGKTYEGKNTDDDLDWMFDTKFSLSSPKIDKLSKTILGMSKIKKVAGNKEIRISTDQYSVDKAIHSKKGRTSREVNARIKAIPEFEEIIRRSTFSHTDTEIVGLNKEAKKGVIAMHYFKTTHNGFDIEIVVRDKGKRQFLYEVKFIENKKSSQQGMPNKVDSPAPKGDAENNNKISQNPKSVKKNFSLKDSKGKTLTKEQQDYFKDSKVRDENGNLLVVYHGTRKADFTVFKRNINFFTDNKEMAESYSPSGEMYEGYLNITNPYVIDAKGEKWSKVPIDETTKQFLQEYGASVFKEVGKWRTTPADIASAIEEAVDNGDLDYDGVIIKNIDDTGSYYKGKDKNLGTDYISFNNNQFKNSDNTNPTSNPDIRFSLKKPVEETKNLIAVHNVWEHKLREAFELGGLPSPSIAITKKDFSHDNFGDISLVFRKETISPTDRRNKVYGGDAYTPARQQIDYKISDKALDKFEGRISKLVDRDIRSAFHLSFDSSNVENDLQRENGNFVEAYKRNEALKIAFLKDKGIPFKAVMKTKEISQFADNVVLRRITRAIGNDTLDKSRQDSKLAFAQEPMIRKLLNDRMEEQGAPRIYDEPLTAYQVDNILMGARDYIWLGEQKTVDYYATRDRLEKKFTKKLTTEYESWLAELGEGIVEKKGIRNDRDLFTPSGNRRSFEALHWDYTLENIVKSMSSQQSKGSAVWGGNVFGASTKEYESIADIKADSSRLQEMSDEEYEAIKAEYKDRLDDIAQAYANGKSYYDAEDTLIEAISIKKTKQGIRSYLAQYDYVYKVTDDIVNDLWELRNDISQMPVSYFEAKPQRAVGFNEVVAAVIPRAKDKSLKTELENRGVKVLEYNKSKDGDRLKKINSVPDVNFSLKGGLSPMEYLNTLEAAQKGKKGAAEKLAKYVDSGMIRTKTYDELIEKYGVIPTGERPHRDIQVPRKSAKNKKVSQTVRTILEAQATPDEAVPTIQKMVEDGVFSYDVYTDKQAITDAESYIKEYGWDESLDDWFDAVNSGEVSKELTTMGWALYNNAANIAATTTSETERTTAIKTALKILDAMVRHQRSAAQALQATRILKKLSPETQLYGVQKSVQALQNELSEKYGDKAPDLKIDEELAEQFINAKTPEERAEVEKEIYKDIGRQMPSRFVDKWNAWRYLAMLGNPRTHIRNIVGNAGFAPVVIAKDLTATVIESAVHRVSGKKTVRGKSVIWGSKSDRSLLKAAWNDYNNVADLISNGGKYSGFAMANQQIEEGRKIFKFKPLEWARKGNSKALEIEDMWFSKPHYAYALAQYCKANNITAEQIGRGKAIAPAREYAIKEAQKATYRDTNAFSQMVSEWGRKKNEKNVVKKTFNTVIEGILPFRKTPANILVRGVEYSPLGLLKGLSYDLVQVGKGKMSATEAIDNISAGLTGTGLLALGVLLAAQGLVRGHGEDEEKEKEFNEMMGHQSYSLELPNGESITLDWLAPEALPFFVGVNMWETTEGSEEEANFSAILQSVSHITEPMLEMSCLQGLNDLFEGIGYASSNDTSGLVSIVSSAVTSYIMQGLPTIFGQIERTFEAYREGQAGRMTTYTEKNGFLTGDMQYTLGKASAKIPGWDYSQIPYIDAWGRKEASGVALKRGLNNFLNPAYTSEIKDSYMEKELLRLFDQTGEASVFPTRADKKFPVDGTDKHLTAEEYVRYATLKGQKSYKAVADLVNSSAYKNLTDAEKAKAIEDAYDYANQKAKEAISNYKPQKWVSTADEFSSVGNYLSFRTEYNNTKEEKGEGFSTQDEIDIILDMAQTDSEIWQMYLSNHKANKDVIAYNMGIEGGKYMTVLQNMDKYDEPNENGNLGTYTNDEISIAIDMTGGLTDSQKAELWQAMTGSKSTKNNPWRRYLP